MYFIYPLHFQLPHPTSNLPPISCCEEKVYSLLNCLDSCMVAGVDYIRSTVSSYLFLFPSCLITCCITQEWKTDLSPSIPKNGDPANVANYRPIALLCVTSKLFEKLIFDSVLDHTYHLIPKNQLGFVCGRSCQQQLLITTPPNS